MSTKCRVQRVFRRPESGLVELLRGLSSADISDCLDRDAAIGAPLMPMNDAPLLGTAFTVLCPPGDNLMFHMALDLADPGDVLVVAGGGDLRHALCGELMANYARSRGLAGFVVEGCVRDRKELSRFSDFPVYALGTVPTGPAMTGAGEINCPVSINGVEIRPGDVLAGDGDGVVVIRPEEVEAVARQARTLSETNEARLTRIRAGGGFSRPRAEAAMRSLEIEYADGGEEK